MIVHVQGYLTFRAPVGKRQVKLEPGARLRGLLEQLAQEGGEALAADLLAPVGGPLPGVSVLVNGRHYKQAEMGLDAPLHDGDEVAIFPPIAGG
jgi:MoaD family protein